MSKSGKFQFTNVVLISVAHHIHDIYTSFLVPVQTLLIDKLSINYTLFGLLSVFQRLPNLLNPYIGILAERVRIRYLMIFAPLITAVSMSLIGIAPTYSFLVIIMVVSGISSMLFHVPTPVMIKHVSGNKTGRGMSFYMVGGELARTLGPIIIVGAIDLWGFENTFRLIPMGMLASALLFIRFRHVDLRKEFPHEQKKGRYNKAFREFLPLLLLIIGISFTRGFMKSCLTYYLPGYMKETGKSLWIAGIALSTVYLSGSAGTFLSGTISDYLGRKRTLLIITVISPLLMGLFIFAGSFWTFPLLIMMGFFLLAPTPVFLAIIHEYKTDHLPFINGLYMTSNFLIGSLSTLLTGIAFDTLGYQITFKLGAAVAFLAIPVVLLFNNDHAKQK
ncbi:MAG: MFS transporter [Bacteroidales bacterium]|nr:MFS transporter [Bacteroidales bacterium]